MEKSLRKLGNYYFVLGTLGNLALSYFLSREIVSTRWDIEYEVNFFKYILYFVAIEVFVVILVTAILHWLDSVLENLKEANSYLAEIAENTEKAKNNTSSDTLTSKSYSNPAPVNKNSGVDWVCPCCGEKNTWRDQFCKSCGKYR